MKVEVAYGFCGRKATLNQLVESVIDLYTGYITFLPVNCQVSFTALSQGVVGSPLSPVFFFVP